MAIKRHLEITATVQQQQIAQASMRLLDTHTQDFLKPSDEPETANKLYYVLITD